MMRKKKLFYGILAVLTLITGIFLINIIFQKEEAIPKQEFPNLLLAHSGGLTKLTYDNLTQSYRKLIFCELENPTAITVVENSIFVTTTGSILRFNMNLKKERELKIGQIGALAASDKNIFLSANGSFIALDKNLKKLSSVQLKDKMLYRAKNAHDILIYNNTAYLLDNVVYPIYIFRVNIENPENIQITDQIEVEGVNHHLDDHWLNPELDEWLIIQSGGHRTGVYQKLLIYSMSDGKMKASRDIYYVYWSLHRDGEEVRRGMPLITVTQFSPAWGVVKRDDKYYLVRINIDENDDVLFSDFLELGLRGEKIIIKRYENHLFIAAGNSLRIVDIEQQPKIILSQEMEEFIIDFVLAE